MSRSALEPLYIVEDIKDDKTYLNSHYYAYIFMIMVLR